VPRAAGFRRNTTLEQARREFFAFIGGGAVLWPVSLSAQAALNAVRSRYLRGGTREDGDKLSAERFPSELAKWDMSRRVIWLSSAGTPTASSILPALAAELITFRPDLIFAPPTPAAAVRIVLNVRGLPCVTSWQSIRADTREARAASFIDSSILIHLRINSGA
jgi:hypothetical protein